MCLSIKDIKEILSILEESAWDEAQVTIGDVTVAVSKSEGLTFFGETAAALASPPPAPPPSSDESDVTMSPPPAGVSTAPATSAQGTGTVVSAPSVGVFWRSPEPGAPPFVEVGQRVETGDTLCIVEVMKLMNHVAANAAGVVVEIHCKNGDYVEHGTPLLTIQTEA